MRLVQMLRSKVVGPNRKTLGLYNDNRYTVYVYDDEVGPEWRAMASFVDLDEAVEYYENVWR